MLHRGGWEERSRGSEPKSATGAEGNIMEKEGALSAAIDIEEEEKEEELLEEADDVDGAGTWPWWEESVEW